MTMAVLTGHRAATTPSPPETTSKGPGSISNLMNLLGITNTSAQPWIEKLPFALEDASAGTETELQAAVCGKRADVDLARSIEASSYFKNLVKRTASGDAPKKILQALEDYLNTSADVWENSWVHFPEAMLSAYARDVFERDLRADKRLAQSPPRRDCNRFSVVLNGERCLRLPISYLLKLSLAQAVGKPHVPEIVRRTGEQMMNHFLNDNTSPETHSFHPVRQAADKSLGKVIAGETLLRYLLTQLLTQYANQRLGLQSRGQQALVYFAPHPPVRQKQLNGMISDAFYRDLFMSPCLSGWDQGETKYRYMILCHEVLSRSQLNTLAKLKEAGIIINNLVVLPNTSNICLANNGTHLSLGSRRLTDMVADPTCNYSQTDEKYYGDLAIKIMEHFLPLFVGTYSAAPYRFDFADFHPEKALGFLPHELDYTHLRMLWRRWKQKADIKCFHHPLTPFGPEWLDRTVSRTLGLRGDLVLDYRLIDYLVALLSTDESPGLDGCCGNEDRLKADLSAMGIFDERMPLYCLCRLRRFGQIGFSGYEARYYSLFASFQEDMGAAADLQQLITLLAYKYIFKRYATHMHIPDNPTVESERRQFFFGAAIGIPTFYVHKNSSNRFLTMILQGASGLRASRRYSGYLRIPAAEYQRALVRLLRRDAQDLIDMLGLEAVVVDLERRISEPRDFSAVHRLVTGITGDRRKNPMRWNAASFNLAAETYYRTSLRKQHIEEAFDLFRTAAEDLDSWQSWRSGRYNQALLKILGGKNVADYLAMVRNTVIAEKQSEEICERLIYLILLIFDHSRWKARKEDPSHDAAPVY